MKLYKLVTRKIILIAALIMLLQVSNITGAFGQVPPPPPPPNSGLGNGHDLGGNQGAPGAPIGGGMEILMVLGALYAGRKVFPLSIKNETETRN